MATAKEQRGRGRREIGTGDEAREQGITKQPTSFEDGVIQSGVDSRIDTVRMTATSASQTTVARHLIRAPHLGCQCERSYGTPGKAYKRAPTANDVGHKGEEGGEISCTPQQVLLLVVQQGSCQLVGPCTFQVYFLCSGCIRKLCILTSPSCITQAVASCSNKASTEEAQ